MKSKEIYPISSKYKGLCTLEQLTFPSSSASVCQVQAESYVQRLLGSVSSSMQNIGLVEQISRSQ